MASPYPYVLENAFPNLDFGDQGPLQVLAAPGDETHLYALCRDGQLYRFENDPKVEQKELFFDISHKVIRDGEEQGLLGFAFHPDYPQNGEFYACYATAIQYGGAALAHDVFVVSLLLLGAILGVFLPIPRWLAHALLIVSTICISAFLVFLLVPTSGLTSDEKMWTALGIFAAGFIAVVLIYGAVFRLNERLATRMAGLGGGLIVASALAVGLTLLMASLVDPSNVSIFGAHATSFQSQVFRRLARRAPKQLKSKLEYSLPDPVANLVVSRFRRNQELQQTDLASEEVLFSVANVGLSHYGGSIEFGPDGFLYIGTGESMFPQWSQDAGTLHGSILRVDVDQRDPGMTYAIPPTNPFATPETNAGERPETWAYGLRNVWRLSFDRETGQLWVGDVGEKRFEEVNLITKGGNYGWPEREGFRSHDPEHSWDLFTPDTMTEHEFVDPVIAYDHRFGKCIIGGRVYRGREFPELQGSYLYADYSSGILWAGQYDGEHPAESIKLASPKLPVSGFGEDHDGELYVCSLDGGIYQLAKIQDDVASQDQPFPQSLSETGLFSSTKDLTPVPGMIPFDVNVPLWSNGADKQRYMALPAAGKIEFSETQPWQFPVGTVFVNHFSIAVADNDQPTQRRLESRLWVNGKYGWDGYTYVWNDAQTDAQLVDQPVTQSLSVPTPHGVGEKHWSSLTTEQCNICHSKVNGFVLGVNTRQMNRNYGDGAQSTNQIEYWNRLGVFSQTVAAQPSDLPAFPSWDPHSPNTRDMARAYLDVNCAVCHVRDRLGLTSIDLRYETPLAETNLVGRRPRRPKSARSSALASLIEPGQPQQSELLRRMRVEDEDRMPPLERSTPDHAATDVIESWIVGMLDDSGAPDQEVTAAMAATAPKWTVPSSYDEAFVRQLVMEVKASGDPVAGREAYLSPVANCVACHRVGEDAQTNASNASHKGPDLSNVGAELSTELIIESILWPGRTIKQGYELKALLLDDGRVISGYVTAEDDSGVTMRDFMTGEVESFDDAMIEHLGRASSAMPSDVTETFTRKQLCDLVAYLSTLKSAAGNAPQR